MSETIQRPHDRKARKDYPCDWCSCQINKGETYEHAIYKYDGEIYQWKSHKDCSWIADKLNMFDHCEDNGLTEEAFIEHINNEFDNLELQPYSNSFSDRLNSVIKHHKKEIE